MAQANFQYVNAAGSGPLQLQVSIAGLSQTSLPFAFDFAFTAGAVSFDRIEFGGTASSTLSTAVAGSRVSIGIEGSVLPSNTGPLFTLFFNRSAAGVLDVDVSRLTLDAAAVDFTDPPALSLQAPTTPLPVFGLVETSMPEDALFGWLPALDNGDPLSFAAISAVPAHGELIQLGGTAWNYRPELNYVGTDAFQLVGTNPTTLQTQKITYRLTITAVNDAPVFAEDSVVLNLAGANSSFSYTAHATDVEDGAALVYALSGPDASGFTIEPATGVMGLAPSRSLVQGVDYAVNVSATDPGGLTDTQQLLIRVGIPGTRSVNGTSASNFLVAEAGNDRVDGGAGTDTMIYNQPRTALQVGWVDGDLRVVGQDSVDSLRNIELVQFVDKTLNLTAPPAGEAPTYGSSNRFLFDPLYYVLSNWDLVPSVSLLTAADHFFTLGGAQGREPAPWFNAQYYANTYADLRAYAGAPALLFAHYNLYGVWEGRAASVELAAFDGARYLQDNPDVEEYVLANLPDFRGSSANGAIAHFVIYGEAEGRNAYTTDGGAIDFDFLI